MSDADLIAILETPRLPAQALIDEMKLRSMSVVDAVPAQGKPFVAVIGLLGNDTAGWATLDDMTSTPNCLGSVILTDRHDLLTYRRAFGSEAAVALLDSTPAAAVDVVAARVRGEIMAPAGVLAACIGDDPNTSLSTGELAVLRNLADGRTISATADQTFYSERHVRRLLQAILAKAQTDDRQTAITFFRHELRNHPS